jgi:hypothetical protein
MSHDKNDSRRKATPDELLALIGDMNGWIYKGYFRLCGV